MVPSGETPTAKSIAPPALFLYVSTPPETLHKAPRQRGFCFFGALSLVLLDSSNSSNAQLALSTAPKSTPSRCLLAARNEPSRIQLELIDTAVLHCGNQTINTGEITRLSPPRRTQNPLTITDERNPNQ